LGTMLELVLLRIVINHLFILKRERVVKNHLVFCFEGEGFKKERVLKN